MQSPATIRLAFDSGWSNGDPGNGRLRFDSPKLSKVKFIYINARDADEAMLGQLVGSWNLGDVIVVERMGNDVNRVVAWVVGAVNHCGSYYQIPVTIRTVRGGFAAHDELELHHHANRSLIDADEPEVSAPLAAPTEPSTVTVTFAPSPLAPLALTANPVSAPLFIASSGSPITPMAPMAMPVSATETPARISATDELEAENKALREIVATLLSDDMEVYLPEGTKQ